MITIITKHKDGSQTKVTINRVSGQPNANYLRKVSASYYDSEGYCKAGLGFDDVLDADTLQRDIDRSFEIVGNSMTGHYSSGKDIDFRTLIV